MPVQGIGSLYLVIWASLDNIGAPSPGCSFRAGNTPYECCASSKQPESLLLAARVSRLVFLGATVDDIPPEAIAGVGPHSAYFVPPTNRLEEEGSCVLVGRQRTERTAGGDQRGAVRSIGDSAQIGQMIYFVSRQEFKRLRLAPFFPPKLGRLQTWSCYLPILQKHH